VSRVVGCALRMYNRRRKAVPALVLYARRKVTFISIDNPNSLSLSFTLCRYYPLGRKKSSKQLFLYIYISTFQTSLSLYQRILNLKVEEMILISYQEEDDGDGVTVLALYNCHVSDG